MNSRRLVIDTDVYIDWLNEGQHEDVLSQAEAIEYLSAIVLMELRAGAFSRTDRRLISRVETAFAKARRILIPSWTVFAEAGNTLRRLQAERGYDPAGSRALVNDVLIALSARSIGATVVTRNGRDYRAIQSVRPFELLIVTRRAA